MTHPTLKITLLLTLLLAPCLPDRAAAQYPRYVLIEQGTAATCPVCFVTNPSFNLFLHQPDISRRTIPIKWSNDRYGADVIFSMNEEMHRKRVNYYGGANFLWKVVVNGITPPSSDSSRYGAGVVTDRVGIRDAIEAVPLTSPTSITVEQIPQSSLTGTVEIRVETEEAIADTRLYIALVEGHHYYEDAGTYDQRHFEWIARRMLPTNDGIPFSLEADSAVVLSQEYAFDTEWDRHQMYVVAWIQDDQTKEVLQAGTNHNNLLAEVGSPDMARGPLQEPKEWEISLEPQESGSYTVALDEANLPNGWDATLHFAGEPIDSAGVITLSAGELHDLTVRVDATGSDDVQLYGDLPVEIMGERGAYFRRILRYYADDIDVILLERDGPYNTYESYFEAALRKGPHTYAVVDPDDEDLFTLDESVVIIETGKYGLSGDDVTDLKEAIDAGGTRLFLSGGEIGFGLADPGNNDPAFVRDEEFMRRYLHATYVRDRNPAGSVSGYADDPVGDGLNLAFTSVALDLNSPDEIRPHDGAVPVFYYGNSDTSVAGIRFADEDNRLVYLAFGAEGINDVDSRQLLLSSAIDWLLASDITGVDHYLSTGSLLHLTAGPNPTDRDITLTFGGTDGPYTVDLYDMRGVSMIETIHGRTTTADQTLRLNVENVPNGMYRLVVKVGDEVRGVPVMVVR